jgi:hypothetical protein
MESYSHFFQTLHDERSPTRFGNGTHASILRAVVFHDPKGMPLNTGATADFAVIWDEDHDTRVLPAIEAIHRRGLLGSILMIGERQGTLNAVVSEQVEDPARLKLLEDNLLAVGQKMEDPWSVSLRRIDSEDHQLIEAENDDVVLYLKTLKMLWKLGVNVNYADRKRANKAERRTASLANLSDEQMVAVMRGIPGAADTIDLAHVEALWNAAEHAAAEHLRKELAAMPPQEQVAHVNAVLAQKRKSYLQALPYKERMAFIKAEKMATPTAEATEAVPTSPTQKLQLVKTT